MYYNTTSQTGVQLARYKDATLAQNERVFSFFQVHRRASPSTVWNLCFQKEVPITSVRRAITTLEKQSRLQKTEEKRQGFYGRDEHVWEIL